MALDEEEILAQAAKIETLLGEFETLPDPAVGAKVMEVVQAIMALYGAGVARVLEIVARQGEPAGAKTLEAFTEDPLISHLLFLHDLHPVDVETRVAQALEQVRPYLQSHGGDVELLGVTDGVARLRLNGHCNGCPSSTITMKHAIEEAILKAAPELIGIDAEGVAEPRPTPPSFIPISTVTVLK